MSNHKDQWARNPGELAWAILPPCLVQQLFPTISTTNTKYTVTSSSYYWPVILYPSWSYAAKQSGLFHNNITTATQMNTSGNSSNSSSSASISSIYQKVSFIDVKTCVTVDQMSKNVVPKKVALGCTSVKGKSLRPKVAAYYLGFAEGIDGNNDNDVQFLGTHCSWSAVDVQNVKRYTIDNCLQILQQYSSHSSNNTMKNKDDTLWSHLLLAMEEASIVSEQCDDSYHPKVLMRQLNVYHEKNPAIMKDNGQHVQKHNNNKSRQQECNVNNENNKDDFLDSLTPEMWSDWRQGGQTQKTMESQSQFVLTAGTTM